MYFFFVILGKHPSIFTGIQYNLYQPPGGFCFENLCSDERPSDPINGAKYITAYESYTLHKILSLLTYR